MKPTPMDSTVLSNDIDYWVGERCPIVARTPHGTYTFVIVSTTFDEPNQRLVLNLVELPAP